MTDQKLQRFRKYYYQALCGGVCTYTEAEFLQEAANLPSDCELRLQATYTPSYVPAGKPFIAQALAMGDVVLEPVIYVP